MKKIAFILPYFGNFPSYFQLFLNSCKHNASIDWFIFTDIEGSYDYPPNARRISMSFHELRARFQEKFDFPIALDTPYKLCDYKPAYGYLFEEYLNGYDFWGHCDLDLLFGDLRKFFPEEELNKYDKIGHLGHLSLYRNCSEINTLFMAEIGGSTRYKEVFTTPHSCIFDEWDDLSINKMFLLSGKKLWLWNAFFDAYPHDDNLVRVICTINPAELTNHPSVSRKNAFITWEDGKIYARYQRRNSWQITELAYAHFQKRDMQVACDDHEPNILCLPDRFVPMGGTIPPKYLLSGMLHRIFNRKHWKQIYQTKKYQLIVKTAPIRHKFKKQ